MTALRLVSRMKRDWMHTGRRPSGLCGAGGSNVTLSSQYLCLILAGTQVQGPHGIKCGLCTSVTCSNIEGQGDPTPFENTNLLNSHNSCQIRPWDIANAKLLVLFYMCHTYVSNRKISKNFKCKTGVLHDFIWIIIPCFY